MLFEFGHHSPRTTEVFGKIEIIRSYQLTKDIQSFKISSLKSVRMSAGVELVFLTRFLYRQSSPTDLFLYPDRSRAELFGIIPNNRPIDCRQCIDQPLGNQKLGQPGKSEGIVNPWSESFSNKRRQLASLPLIGYDTCV